MSIYAYDPLYLDRVRLMKLGCNAPPIEDDDITDLRKLLRLVNHIIRPTTSSASQYKKELEKLQKTTPRQLLMHDRASEIGRQMAFQDEMSKPEKKTWKMLEGSPDIPLKTMAVLSLVAFATMYGKVQVVADHNSNPELAKSIALLKQELTATESFKNWSDTLKSVLGSALDVAARVMDLEEPRGQAFFFNDANKRLLASAVHKILNVVTICWSQVVQILIKRTRNVLRETLWRKSALLHSNVWTLQNKLTEIKILMQDSNDIYPKQQPVPRDSNEAAISLRASPSWLCWWKLRQMLNPNNRKSLPYRMPSSTGQGALPADEEESG